MLGFLPRTETTATPFLIPSDSTPNASTNLCASFGSRATLGRCVVGRAEDIASASKA